MADKVKIISTKKITHDVVRLQFEKPEGFSYVPGQAADICINKPGWENEKRPFTFTSLTSDDHLEFTIKTYPEHKGVTNQVLTLQPGDELILHDVFGDIAYKDEGLFIAGGAGITPFIAIFNDLRSKNAVGNNRLMFANKTKADIILEDEFKKLLGENFINILSDENIEGYEHGYISAELIKKHLLTGNRIYLCGPPPMMDAVEKHLAELQVDKERLIKEAF